MLTFWKYLYYVYSAFDPFLTVPGVRVAWVHFTHKLQSSKRPGGLCHHRGRRVSVLLKGKPKTLLLWEYKTWIIRCVFLGEKIEMFCWKSLKTPLKDGGFYKGVVISRMPMLMAIFSRFGDAMMPFLTDRQLAGTDCSFWSILKAIESWHLQWRKQQINQRAVCVFVTEKTSTAMGGNWWGVFGLWRLRCECHLRGRLPGKSHGATLPKSRPPVMDGDISWRMVTAGDGRWQMVMDKACGGAFDVN